MSERLSAGDVAPAFTLSDADGVTTALSDYRGKNVVVYFYPKAATPGCTTEACDFRDSLSSLAAAAAGYAVVGVSPDEVADIKSFSDAEGLTFPLLADTDASVARAWGVWGEKTVDGRTFEGVIRSTFVLDGEGVVQRAEYGVDANGHVARLREELGV